MMRLLVAIPHFFDPAGSPQSRRHGAQSADARSRVAALASCIHSLHQLYGSPQCMMQFVHRRTQAANERLRGEVHVAVCTTGHRHLLERLPVNASFYHHHATDAEPLLLGFECHALLRDRSGDYDYYCYLEDDLMLHDPWLFVKLAWFNRLAGRDKLLLPNRFERGTQPLVTKAYVDGDLSEAATSRFQNLDVEPELNGTVMGLPVTFRRPFNPHAGCFFLTAEQMAHWQRQPHFLDRETSFIGPLESAATLSVMRTFQIYKPAIENASFLEIEHFGTGFLSQLRKKEEG